MGFYESRYQGNINEFEGVRETFLEEVMFKWDLRVRRNYQEQKKKSCPAGNTACAKGLWLAYGK